MSFLPFRVVAADPNWSFDDELNPTGEVKRGASSHYRVMSVDEIAALPVADIVDDDAVCCLWRPSSMAAEGDRVLRAWDFRPTGEWVWSKRPAPPTEEELARLVLEVLAEKRMQGKPPEAIAARAAKAISARIGKLHFGLGRLTRAAKEVAAIGVRGSLYRHLANRSIRDVFEAPALAHSVKTEIVQDALEVMFPGGPYVELFARRARSKWVCIGDESPHTRGQDIREVLPAIARKITRSRP